MGVLETTYRNALEKPLRILEIFNDFFGEDKVDMQGYPTLSEVESGLPDNASTAVVSRFISTWQHDQNTNFFILVHFPHVRITNEHDRYVDINHLYAKVAFDIRGTMCGRFQLNRSDYTLLHLSNDYMHSHVSTIPLYSLRDFQTPCTGSGPINNTIASLSRDFDENLWQLFCLELERYVHVESIAGTPYHRLEGLTPRGVRLIPIANTLNYRLKFPSNNRTYVTMFAEFTKHLIDSGCLKFHYTDGQYKLAMSTTSAYIAISNCFIKWYNREFAKGNQTIHTADLISTNVLQTCKYSNGQLMVPHGRRSNADYYSHVGALMFYFKGNPVRFTISDVNPATESDNDVIILTTPFIEYILTKIINVINFHYGNQRNQGNQENSSRKAVYYL